MRLWFHRSTADGADPSPGDRLVSAVERIPDAVAIVSADGEPTWWNHAADAYVLRDGTSRPAPVHEALLGGSRRATQLSWYVEDGETWSGEQVLLAPDGREVPAHLVVVPRVAEDGVADGYVVFARDLSAQRAAEADLARGVIHDELTGVGTATLLGSRLDLSLRRLRGAHDGLAALALLDIDGLRIVNESVGRDAGDALLREIAIRLCRRLRPTDALARLRGGEFAFLVEDRPDLRSISSLADDLLDCVREPLVAHGASIMPRASIGVVRLDAADTVAAVLRRADGALQYAKYSGGDTVVIDDGGLLLSAEGGPGLEAAVRHALGRTPIPLHFQPATDLRTGATAYVEALLRVAHPTVGRVPPPDVVSTAGRMGRLTQLTGMTLHAAMDAAVRWDAGIGVAVNVSADELHDERLVGLVEDALAATGMAAPRLLLDVTETAFVADPDRTVEVASELRDLGVRIALDGLGEDWPSLSTLRALPLDVVKIDRTLLVEAATSRRACAVLGAVLGVAEVLGITSVAGGIETDEQLEQARALGFELAQGHRIAQPSARGDCAALLA